MSGALDDLDDAAQWVDGAVGRALDVWCRLGRRYVRRLADQDRVRDAAEDVMTLAARRLVPLSRAVLRPLPADRADPLVAAFNGLDRADRYVLARLPLLGGVRGPRGEHLASALERLVIARRSRV